MHGERDPRTAGMLQSVVTRAIQTTREGALLQAFYEEIMVEAFRPDELGGPYWDPGKDDPTVRTILALGPDETVLGGVVGEWFPRSEVLLIAWVAVRAGLRGQGIGSMLMQRAAEEWYGLPGTSLVVGELDDPRHWPSEDQDPVARLRFYDRFGVKAMPTPYFQPAIGSEYNPVYRMFLASFDPRASAIAPDGSVDGAVVREFIHEYLVGTSHLCGRGGDLDEDGEWLLSFYDGRPIPLLPLLEYERIETPEPPGTAPPDGT